MLLLGPLYHLTVPTDRSAALREARRMLRPGGLVLAVGIARFATALYGLFQDCLDEPGYLDIMARDLVDGQHRGRSEPPLNFTTAYLHRPEELATEFVEAALCHETTLAIEGVGWLLQDLDQQWADPDHRQRLLDLLRTLEAEPTIHYFERSWGAHLVAQGFVTNVSFCTGLVSLRGTPTASELLPCLKCTLAASTFRGHP